MFWQYGEALYLLIAGKLLLKRLYAVGHHLVDARVGAQVFAAAKLYVVVAGVFLEQGIVGYNQCRHKLALVGYDGYLVDKLVNKQLRLYHLRRYIFAVGCLEEVFYPVFQEEFTFTYIA